MKLRTLKLILIGCLISAVLGVAIIIGARAAWHTDNYLEHSLNLNTAAQYGEWIPTQDTFSDGEVMPWFFYTCSGNGRKEGTIYLNRDGTWHARSEHETDHYDKIDADFRTQALAKKAVEDFVRENGFCK